MNTLSRPGEYPNLIHYTKLPKGGVIFIEMSSAARELGRNRTSVPQSLSRHSARYTP